MEQKQGQVFLYPFFFPREQLPRAARGFFPVPCSGGCAPLPAVQAACTSEVSLSRLPLLPALSPPCMWDTFRVPPRRSWARLFHSSFRQFTAACLSWPWITLETP